MDYQTLHFQIGMLTYSEEVLVIGFALLAFGLVAFTVAKRRFIGLLLLVAGIAMIMIPPYFNSLGL